MENLTYLVKFLALHANLSRRKAEEAIRAGSVTVNGQLVTNPAYKVLPTDHVKFEGKLLQKNSSKLYILLNKPELVITTAKDSQGRTTVFDLLPKSFRAKVFPVGRLDFMTKGLLLLTNDGDLAYRLSHPKFEVEKTYAVTLDRDITQAELDVLTKGFFLYDGFIKADKAVFASRSATRKILVSLHSGKNRIIRRIFSHIGYTVMELERVGFASLSIKGLQPGKHRVASKEEIAALTALVPLKT